MLTDGLEWCGLLVMFLSAVWTLILTAPIHCRASIADTLMQCYISPNLMKKQTHPSLGWPEGEDILANCNFWLNCSFKSCFISLDLLVLRSTDRNAERCATVAAALTLESLFVLPLIIYLWQVAYGLIYSHRSNLRQFSSPVWTHTWLRCCFFHTLFLS